jgi:hypothetical protein
LNFCLGYFNDSLNIFFIKNKKIISFNILIITCLDPSRLSLAWLAESGARVWQTMLDPRCVGLV